MVGARGRGQRGAEGLGARRASSRRHRQTQGQVAPGAQPADTAKKSQAGDEAFYQKWQFWAVTGGIVVGAVALIFGGKALYHSINGGDVRPCNPSFIGCDGQGHAMKLFRFLRALPLLAVVLGGLTGGCNTTTTTTST